MTEKPFDFDSFVSRLVEQADPAPRPEHREAVVAMVSASLHRDHVGDIKAIGKNGASVSPDHIVAEVRSAWPSYFAKPSDSSASKAWAGPNPFAEGTINRTGQAILLNTDPERAARLQAEALRAKGEPNPFRKGPDFNRTAQHQMIRDEPDRAARLQAEAGKAR